MRPFHRVLCLVLLLLLFLPLLSVPVVSAAAAQSAELTEETTGPDWDMTPLPDSWFDDAVFFGDSVSITLKKHCAKTDDLGDALFLCEYSFGVRNAVSGKVKVWYKGEEYKPHQVIPLTGKKKVFAMFGANDIALYGGIDRTMEKWQTLIDRIRKKSPDVEIFIESCFPVYHTINYDGLNNKAIDKYNKRLIEFCEKNDCVYVDLAHYFKDKKNGMALKYSSDQYVHITYEAAELWVEQLKNPANYSVDPRSFDYEKK